MRKNVSVMFALVIVMMTLAMSSCKKENRLKQMAELGNKECPMSMGLMGEMVSISYDESSNTVIYDYLMNEEYFNVEVMNKNTDLLKENAYSLFATAEGELKLLVDEVLATEANLVFRYKGKESGDVVEFKMTSQDIKEARETGAAFVGPLKMLENAIKVTNDQTPMVVDEFTTMIGLSIVGDYATYEYELDESQISIHRLDDMKDGFKETLKSNLLNVNDLSIKAFVQLCKKANKGIAYKYIGKQSGNICVIEIDVTEL